MKKNKGKNEKKDNCRRIEEKNEVTDMLKSLFDVGTKQLKKYQKQVKKINEIEPEIQSLSDEDLKRKTKEFKERLQNGETLDDLLIEAFAVVREAAKRVLGMRHFDVQLIGGMALHYGFIAEMKTGEGKTLVATLPSYLNALEGKGVHVITANEYLARRDKETLEPLFAFLDMTVGLNLNEMMYDAKQEAYRCDITYGTNNEFGFDYLRDNMARSQSDYVQRELHYAIIDEVDSILIDEARTPLIISGSGDKSTSLYIQANAAVKMLQTEKDYTVDIKQKQVFLTDEGIAKLEKNFGIENIFDVKHMTLNHHINQALRAHVIMKRDIDYVVQDGEILIVDEFTGRIMNGRRYSDGLHQAIEAKEGLQVKDESQTLATITMQNYFRMYGKLSGMTGTAKTEEEEFKSIYYTNVVVIPTNRPMIRKDLPDSIYKTEEGKYKAVVERVAQAHEKGQPVLVGTISIENSEKLSSMLKKKGVKHHVLNAKNHEKEAEIIREAGQKGAVTIATNMAGRGTDIILGDDVKEVGGLLIIGTERHESRRIDNQLRGRSGRQGDPGESVFFISLQDELTRRFGGDNLEKMMDKLGFDETTPVESRMVTKVIEGAQKRVEGANFDSRKYVLQYDTVLNHQREVIYKQRREILKGEGTKELFLSMMEEESRNVIDRICTDDMVPEEWDMDKLLAAIESYISHGRIKKEMLQNKEKEELYAIVKQQMDADFEEKKEILHTYLEEFVQMVIIHTVDRKWMDHLENMTQLKQGMHLRAYGQKNPVQEYELEGYDMFNRLLSEIQGEIVQRVLKTKVEKEEDVRMREERVVVSTNKDETTEKKKPVHIEKHGRNAPCHCGSGKKYKNCHGRK